MRLITLLFLLVSFGAVAQTRIRGVVRDAKGEGLPGVNLILKDTYDGTSSTADGSFIFTTEERGAKTLVATFVGYVATTRPLSLEGQEITLEIVLEEEVSQLDAVVISAGSYTAGEEKRRTVLKPLDIATTAGATADIAGALNSLPGTQKVGETGRLFVRGGDGTETRTFVDGMVVMNPYGPSAPNTPSRGRFLPFMFKGTSFSTGGYSAEYGQAASSALVLNSKDKAEAAQTDIGLLSVGMDVAHTNVWNTGSASAKIQYTNLQPYTDLIKQRVDWTNAPVSLEGIAAVRQEIGKGMLKAFGMVSQTDYSLNEHSIADPTQYWPLDLSNRYRYGNLTYKTELGGDWGLRSGLSYSYNRNAYRLNGSPAEETEKGTHAKAVGERTFGRLDFKVGMEVLDRDYAASRYNDTTAQTLSRAFHETIASGFSEGEMRLSNHFVVRAGARYEYNSLNNRSFVDPRASLAFRPGRRGQFSLAYGMFHQSAPNAYLAIDHTLQPERADHFIANYQVVTDKQTFRVELYHKRYTGLVKFPGTDLSQLSNNGTGYAQGFELFWRDNKTFRNVDYWVSYSYLDTKRDYLNYPMAAVPTFASTHNFSFVYKHFITNLRTQVGFTYSYASPRTYYNPNLTSEKFLSDLTPSYQDLSVNISYLPKTWMIVYVSCTNLLGRDNIFGYTYSPIPDANGVYASRAVRQPATNFLFLGVFITLSKNKSVNQLPNL